VKEQRAMAAEHAAHQPTQARETRVCEGHGENGRWAGDDGIGGVDDLRGAL